jgi:DNA (cytosine-5)-methyltransferase 1
MKQIEYAKSGLPAAVKDPTFIDVFAGCGGLSLGLMEAGWQGLFAVEKNENAFLTLSANLIATKRERRFSWPKWLPRKPHSIGSLLDTYGTELGKLHRSVDMLVGGPPCQGFSSAGRRDPNDPRNQLVTDYLRLVNIIEPKIVLIENVRGITADFDEARVSTGKINYAKWIQKALSKKYSVFSKMIDLSEFGVPQKRHRFFFIAVTPGTGH